MQNLTSAIADQWQCCSFLDKAGQLTQDNERADHLTTFLILLEFHNLLPVQPSDRHQPCIPYTSAEPSMEAAGIALAVSHLVVKGLEVYLDRGKKAKKYCGG